MRRKAAAWLLLALLIAGRAARSQQPPSARDERAPAAHMANAEDVRKRLGLVPDYAGIAGIDSVKVAVLDYGFAGVDNDAGKGRGLRYLPESAEVVEHYDPTFVRRFDLGDPEY